MRERLMLSGYSSSNSVLAQYGIQEPLVINGRKKRELRGMMMNKDTNSRNYKTTTKSTRIQKRPNPKKGRNSFKNDFKKSGKTVKNSKAQVKSDGKLRKDVKRKVIKGRSSGKLTKEVKGKETKGKSSGKLSKEEKRKLERKKQRKQKRNQKELKRSIKIHFIFYSFLILHKMSFSFYDHFSQKKEKRKEKR